jgi:hypothetical protein
MRALSIRASAIFPLRSALLISKPQSSALQARRAFSKYVSDSTLLFTYSNLIHNNIIPVDDDYEIWPRTVPNTIVNICPKGEFMVVERLGVMQPIVTGGWFIAVPFIDNIRYCVDMRERAISIRPQSAITKDNVHVQVSGNLYCQFIDAEKAAYGSKNPIYAVIIISRLFYFSEIF